MKKTIASVALLASAASTLAFIGPSPVQQQVGDQVSSGSMAQPVQKYFCLDLFEDQDGSKILGSCDKSSDNIIRNREVDERGCTESQAALAVTQSIHIQACPSYMQL